MLMPERISERLVPLQGRLRDDAYLDFSPVACDFNPAILGPDRRHEIPGLARRAKRVKQGEYIRTAETASRGGGDGRSPAGISALNKIDLMERAYQIMCEGAWKKSGATYATCGALTRPPCNPAAYVADKEGRTHTQDRVQHSVRRDAVRIRAPRMNDRARQGHR
jgi:hypothetical protein